MPATGPQPAEVTKCFEGQPGKYGHDLISTAGYMIQGHRPGRHLVLRKAIKPAAGYRRPDALIDLVRNPNYKQSTDTTRKNYADEVRFIVDSSATDIYNKVEAGQLDLATVAASRRRSCEKYATTPSLKPYFLLNSGDRTWYLTMNLTQAPFDDIHVRRAMNWIMDKAALRQAWGGPTVGDDREPHRPGHAVQRPAAGVRAVQDPRRPRQRREGEGGDEGLEVRHERRRHVRRRRRARTCC